MPSETDRFVPGDEVTVEAQGFAADDEIMLDIRWPLSSGPLQEGSARGVYAVIRERTATNITFLAPGGYPASTVGVELLRQGRVQLLGKIAVADGQAPDEFRLYGITTAAANNDAPRGIDRIDRTTGDVTRIADFDAGSDLKCAVGAPGTNRIYGLSVTGSGSLGCFYDLTMRYWRDSDSEQYLTVGTNSQSVSYLGYSDNRLNLTSMNTPSPEVPVSWSLPEGLTASMLSDYPFLFCWESSRILLTAARGDGTFSPVVLCPPLQGCRVDVGDPVQADALIPFNTLRTVQTEGKPDQKYWISGYVVSNAGESKLCLFDPTSMAFSEPFATISDAVRSVAVDWDSEGQDIYLLTESAQGGSIRVYNEQTAQWRSLPGDRLPYSEIVLAR